MLAAPFLTNFIQHANMCPQPSMKLMPCTQGNAFVIQSAKIKTFTDKITSFFVVIFFNEAAVTEYIFHWIAFPSPLD